MWLYHDFSSIVICLNSPEVLIKMPSGFSFLFLFSILVSNPFTFFVCPFYSLLENSALHDSRSPLHMSPQKWMLECCGCGRVDFVPRFSDGSAHPFNCHRLGLLTLAPSRKCSQRLARNLLVLWSQQRVSS